MYVVFSIIWIMFDYFYFDMFAYVGMFNCGLTVGFCSAFIFAVVFICKSVLFIVSLEMVRSVPRSMDKQSSPHQNLVRD